MAHYTPEALSQELNHDVLLRQFVFCKQLNLIPQGWRRESVADYWVGIHPELPVSTIRFSRESKYKGYMLGYVIDPFKCEYNKPHIDTSNTIGIEEEHNYESIEAYLDTLSGRFVCLVTNGVSNRIYLDASGSFSMVYAADQKIAAASSMLIPYEQEVDDDSQLIETLSIDEKNGIYPFGLTSRKKVKRLLPNHYLDLDNWKAIRHWPHTSFEIIDDAEQVAAKIGNIMEKTIDTIMQQGFKPYMSLTAGVDSRTMLACAKKWKDNINFFTWELPDNDAELDVNIATQLADEHQLNYSRYPFEEANEQDQKEWLYRTSLSVGEMRGRSLSSTIKAMDSEQPYFAGNVSEVSRGVYWRDETDALSKLTGEELTKRVGAPNEAVITSAANKWLASLPNMTISEKLDLAYLEQRVGCWASEIAHGHAGGPFHIYPFSNRMIFELMLCSPNDFNYRKSKGIIKEIIKQKMPELMQLDFNGGNVRI